MSKRGVLIILSFILILSIILPLGIGSVNISYHSIGKILLPPFLKENSSSIHKTIILEVRLPRIILGFLVGASLSVGGCIMQGLFRNPMASPFVTGIASGGAFGAALTILTGLGNFWIEPLSFFFASSSALLVYYLAKTKTGVSTEILLLSGIALSLLYTSLVSLMQYIANERELREIVLWLMGRLYEANWSKVLLSSPLILFGTTILYFFYRELNIMLLGDRSALDLGVEVEKLRKIILLLVSLITSAAVSVSGIIGFVGLIIPHVMRLIIGPDHKYLLPASVLGGSIFLIWADTLSRVILSPVELPVGIITGILGVPFFLFLLRRRKKMVGFSSYGT